MKLSRWNSYIELGGGKGLVYNSFADRFLVVKDVSGDFVHARAGSISDLSSGFVDQMMKAGAIVDDDVDEVAEVGKMIGEVDNDDSTFELIVNPTLDCNFHCWYCYENHLKGSKMDEGIVSAITTLIKDRIYKQNNIRNFHLSFFGGEPLLCFDSVVLPLIKESDAICTKSDVVFSVHFTTNAYLITEDMIEHLAPFRPSFQITLDGGESHHDNTRFAEGKKPSFRIIINNIRRLSMAGMTVILRINYTERNLDSTQEIIDILESFPKECRENIRVDYQRVWQDIPFDGKFKLEEKVDILRKRLIEIGYGISNNRIIDYVRNTCYGNRRNELLVNFNGDVFACTARDFNTESRLGFLTLEGKVEWNEELMKIRRTCRFSKKVCHDCRIAPLCGGGCRTKCMEHAGHDNCNLGFTLEDIDNIILDKFEARYMGD